jgi:radical SAM protein with 4Fe4S-binding SPASM domain
LIESGLDHIEVSIDAVTPETYFKIRRSPMFERLVENTLAYIGESKAYNQNSRVTVSFVLQTDNQHEYKAFKQFWSGKADEVYIRRYHQHHNLVDNHGHFQEKHYKFRHPCPYLWDRIIIYHNGQIRFCESDWKAEHAIGNIQNQTIKEIWHGEIYCRLRQQHIDGIFAHPFCKVCTDWREVKWSDL